MTASRKRDVARHPWRENLETAAVAIVMALVLKYFTLEAFQIPTGSMQPTLMGLDTSRTGDGPGVRVFDRILVDKLLPFLRDARRFEVWVFTYPLDRSERYIKRVVGMPGESLKIEHGDVFARTSAQEEWRIVRKPRKVQDHLWRESWSEAHGPPGEAWDLTRFEEKPGGALAATGEASAELRRQVQDRYVDGYPPALRRALEESGGHAPGTSIVRDVRLRLAVRPTAEHRRLAFALGWGGDHVQGEISGPSGDGKARLSFNDRVLAEVDARLEHATSSDVAFFRADEAMELRVEGRTVARVEFESTGTVGNNRVTFETEGGAVAIESLALDRDIQYTNRIGSQEFRSVDVPEGHYFMLGDNSIESADGRAWMGVQVDLAAPVDGAKTLFGGTTTSGASSKTNPRIVMSQRSLRQTTMIFRDEFGEEYRYAQGTPRSPQPRPFVRRDYFLGRAFFVFWPFPPFAPVVRIGVVR